MTTNQHLSMTEAADMVRSAYICGPWPTPSRDSIRKLLRRESTRSILAYRTGPRGRGRWMFNRASVERFCAEIVGRTNAKRAEIVWDERARLCVAILLHEAMTGDGRDASWPFDVCGWVGDDEDAALWSALNKLRLKLGAEPRVDEGACDWANRLLLTHVTGKKPNLRLVK